MIFPKVGASYIALALSQDDEMGDDSVIECVRNGDTINAFVSFTTPRSDPSSTRDEVRFKVDEVILDLRHDESNES